MIVTFTALHPVGTVWIPMAGEGMKENRETVG